MLAASVACPCWLCCIIWRKWSGEAATKTRRRPRTPNEETGFLNLVAEQLGPPRDW